MPVSAVASALLSRSSCASSVWPRAIAMCSSVQLPSFVCSTRSLTFWLMHSMRAWISWSKLSGAVCFTSSTSVCDSSPRRGLLLEVDGSASLFAEHD